MSTTTTTAKDLFVNLLVEAQFQAYENSYARAVTTVYDVTGESGKTIQIPVYPGLTAEALSEGVAPSATAVSTDSVEITLGEIGIYKRVTDFLRASSSRDVVADLGLNMGMAMAEKLDTDVFGLFDGFTTDVGPGTTNSITVADLFKAAAILRANKQTGPYYAVVHPAAAYDLKLELASTGATGIPALSNVGNSVLANGYIGTVAGITVIESGVIAVDGAGDAVGAVFAPGAIGVAIRGTLNMETQRQAAARAEDLVMTMVKGEKIINQAAGVALTGKATI